VPAPQAQSVIFMLFREPTAHRGDYSTSGCGDTG
jgi:hypothetical protein